MTDEAIKPTHRRIWNLIIISHVSDRWAIDSKVRRGITEESRRLGLQFGAAKRFARRYRGEFAVHCASWKQTAIVRPLLVGFRRLDGPEVLQATLNVAPGSYRSPCPCAPLPAVPIACGSRLSCWPTASSVTGTQGCMIAASPAAVTPET
jgi:hypothetical protein